MATSFFSLLRISDFDGSVNCLHKIAKIILRSVLVRKTLFSLILTIETKLFFNKPNKISYWIIKMLVWGDTELYLKLSWYTILYVFIALYI